ncbi:MAG: hypothetical protein IKT68_01930 [Clostridia bacterium]|nr:hypothetical protein [Clostridia bacterium]
MNKRLIAVFLSIIMLIAFTFAGCSTDSTDTPAQSTAAVAATPRQQFLDGLEKAMTKTLGARVFASQDMKAAVEMKLNQLSVGGNDILGGSPMNVTMNTAYDADSDLSQIRLDLSVLSQQFSGELVCNDQAVYITDLLGLNDKPIALDLSLLTDLMAQQDPSEFNQQDAQQMTEVLNALTEFMGTLEQELETIIGTAIPDSAFVTETKDCTVGGTALKGATVITVTVDANMLADILSQVLALAQENQFFKMFLVPGSGDPHAYKEEFLKTIGNYTLTLVNTMADGATVGLDATVADGNGDATFSFNGYMLPDSFLFKAEMGANGFEFSGKQEASGNVTAQLTVTENGNTTTPVQVNGKKQGDKVVGVLTVSEGSQTVGIDFGLVATDTTFELEITKIAVAGSELPLNVTVAVRTEGNKESVELQWKMSIPGTLDLDLSATAQVEYTDVTVAPVTDSVPFDQVDFLTLGTKLLEKYPGLADVVSGMVQDAMGDMGDLYDIPLDEMEDLYEDYDMEELEDLYNQLYNMDESYDYGELSDFMDMVV